MTVPGHEPPHYPGYDVMSQRPRWDDETTAVVLKRLAPPGPLQFFTTQEERAVRALVDLLLDQYEEPRIPVTEMIDARLRDREFDGYRYDTMPDDDVAWQRSIAGLDDDARERHGVPFAALAPEDRTALVLEVRFGEGTRWGMPAARVYDLWMRYACSAFYSHPWAWNEIGFGGPAYPRGYKALGVGKREPWERDEAEAIDPVPWGERVERARRRATGVFPPSPDDAPQPSASGRRER